MLITEQNFRSHIGKEVRVEISCKEFGLCYPDRNILVGMNHLCFYFETIEADGSESQFWHYDIEDKQCTTEVFSIE